MNSSVASDESWNNSGAKLHEVGLVKDRFDKHCFTLPRTCINFHEACPKEKHQKVLVHTIPLIQQARVLNETKRRISQAHRRDVPEGNIGWSRSAQAQVQQQVVSSQMDTWAVLARSSALAWSSAISHLPNGITGIRESQDAQRIRITYVHWQSPFSRSE